MTAVALLRGGDAGDWSVLSRLLDAALDLPPERRGEWVEALAPGHAALKPRLRELLAGASRPDSRGFLHTIPKIDGEDGAAGDEHGGRSGQVGETVGPYRLLRVLAEGGMGSVWLAERTDGLIQRPVALKLPRGAWRRAGLAERMAIERDILAALGHPNIARLYDAGLAADGQPYLALEYVQGRRIDDYCREKRLDVAARLRLFVEVARAVAHAHAKLVVHRDLKPANVLVTDEGQVRLLDFGIAKLLEQGRAHESELTLLSGRAFTPDYASPEQIAGEPVTTASDVYSLGVMLYELLAEARPYRLPRDSHRALEAAVLRVEPARPSDVAPAPLRRALRGDLDTIVLKALKKQPGERYATVDALVEDVERHLHGRPVIARPDSTCYRVTRFVKRNRIAVLAAAAVLAAVLVGAAASVWQARRALDERRRTAEVTEFLTSILRDSSPHDSPGRAATVLDLLAQARAKIEARPDARPELRVELLGIVGSSFLSHQDTAAAESLLERAVAEARRELGPLHPQTLRARVRLLAVHRFRGRTQAIRDELRVLLPLLRRDAQGFAEELVSALREQAQLEIDEGRYEQAERAAEEAVGVADERLAPDHPERVGASVVLGLASQLSRDPSLALERTARAYRLAREVYPGNPKHPRAIEAGFLYGRALASAGRLSEGLARIAGAVAAASEVFGPSSRMVGIFSQELARWRLRSGEIEAAIESSRKALAIIARHSERDSYRHAAASLMHGEALLAARRSKEATPHLSHAAETLARALGPEHGMTDLAGASLALAWAYEGAADEARRRVRAMLERRAGARRPPRLAQYVLGMVLREAGDPAAALRLQQDWLDALGTGPERRLDRARTLAEIGLAHLALGQPDATVAALERSLPLLEEAQGPTPRRAEAQMGLGRAKLALGRPGEALPALEAADRFWRAFDRESQGAAEAALWLARCRAALGRGAQAGASLARASAKPPLGPLRENPPQAPAPTAGEASRSLSRSAAESARLRGSGTRSTP